MFIVFFFCAEAKEKVYLHYVIYTCSGIQYLLRLIGKEIA